MAAEFCWQLLLTRLAPGPAADLATIADTSWSAVLAGQVNQVNHRVWVLGFKSSQVNQSDLGRHHHPYRRILTGLTHYPSPFLPFSSLLTLIALPSIISNSGNSLYLASCTIPFSSIPLLDDHYRSTTAAARITIIIIPSTSQHRIAIIIIIISNLIIALRRRRQVSHISF